MAAVEVNGLRIEYESLGKPSDPPIVLIMGLGMQLVAWPEAFCQGLVERGFRVIRFDNRDCGLSGRIHLKKRPNLLLAFASASLSRRLLWFPLAQQALQVLPLLLLTQVVQVLMRLAVGAEFPGWGYFVGPLIASLLWVPLTFVLLLPQYQPVEQNPDRPI